MKRLISIALCIFLSQISSGQVMMLFSSDSLTNITSPLDLDSLFYWFAADQGVTDSLGGAIATDEGVGTWNDLSGNGYNVTQTTNGARPVYKATGGPGSKPCIQFDGSNDFLASAAHWWGSDDLTVFVVMKFGNATRDAAENIFGKSEGPAGDRQFLLQAQGAPNYFNIFATSPDGSATFGFFNDGAKSASYSTISVIWTGTALSNIFLVDGADVSATLSGNANKTIYNTATSRFSVGAVNVLSTPVNFLQGSISEIIVYSRALSSTERAAIELYLNRKYDLYYLIIIGFPLAPTVGAKRRKLIPNDKKKAA